LKVKKEIIPLPFPAYYIPTLILALGGLADSIYLAVSHYRVYTDIGYSSFCAISKSINCDTVSQSPFSILSNVPVPVWGVLGYLGFTLILVKAWGERHRDKDGWALLQVLAAFFSLYSVILAFISTYFINSYCIMCIISYGINLLLLFYTSMIRRRFKLPTLYAGLKRDLQVVWRSPPLRGAVAGIVVTAVAGIFYFPAYWQYEMKLAAHDVESGVTTEGYPWIGAQVPELVITEFSDYQCFQCRKMHHYLRRLVQQHPDRIRLVHRHFPMDHQVNPLVKEPFHVGSAQMAILALYAQHEEKFWLMNDALYQAVARKKEAIELSALAETTGLELRQLQSALSQRADLHQALMRDILDGLKLEITGTPAYLINGDVHLAQIPPEILRRF
jgi:uncharacterized membrane protein/protein-disulfide isomerase